MNLTTISEGVTYQVSGEDLKEMMRQAAIEGISRYLEQNQEPVKRKLNSKEACEYLRIKAPTLAKWIVRYKMQYEKGSPNFFSLEELQRVERERNIKMQ